MSGAALRALCATRLTEMEAACAAVRAQIETPSATNQDVLTPLEVTLSRGIEYMRRHLGQAIHEENPNMRKTDAERV